MSISAVAHDPSARFAGTSPRKAWGGTMGQGGIIMRSITAFLGVLALIVAGTLIDPFAPAGLTEADWTECGDERPARIPA